MRLAQAARMRQAEINAGGPGSGCRGPNCGRPCLTPGCPEQQPTGTRSKPQQKLSWRTQQHVTVVRLGHGTLAEYRGYLERAIRQQKENAHEPAWMREAYARNVEEFREVVNYLEQHPEIEREAQKRRAGIQPPPTPPAPQPQPQPKPSPGITEPPPGPARVTVPALMRLTGWTKTGNGTLKNRPSTIWEHAQHGKIEISNNWYKHWDKNGILAGEKTDLSTGTPLAEKLRTYMRQKGMIGGTPAVAPGGGPRPVVPPDLGIERKQKGWLNSTELAKVPDRPDIAVRVAGYSSDNRANIQAMMGMTVEQYTNVLFKDTQGVDLQNVQVTYTPIYGGFSYDITAQVDGKHWEMDRELYQHEGYVYHSLFRMDETQTGAGLGKIMFRNSLDLYDHMGLNRIKVTANISVGGYAWAKYGFLQTKNHWDEFRSQLMGRYYGTINKITDPAQREMVKKLLDSPDPKALHALADMNTINRYDERKKRNITVGQDMLLHTTWSGYLKLNDRYQYTKARMYSAKKAA